MPRTETAAKRARRAVHMTAAAMLRPSLRRRLRTSLGCSILGTATSRGIPNFLGHALEFLHGFVEKLQQKDDAAAQSQAGHDAHQKQLAHVGRLGLVGQAGGIQNAELLALLLALHVGGHLGFLLAGQQRVVCFLGIVVVAFEGQELLFQFGRVFDPPLINGDLFLQSRQFFPDGDNFPGGAVALRDQIGFDPPAGRRRPTLPAGREDPPAPEFAESGGLSFSSSSIFLCSLITSGCCGV